MRPIGSLTWCRAGQRRRKRGPENVGADGRRLAAGGQRLADGGWRLTACGSLHICYRHSRKCTTVIPANAGIQGR
jgi:hypothetical protein